MKHTAPCNMKNAGVQNNKKGPKRVSYKGSNHDGTMFLILPVCPDIMYRSGCVTALGNA